MFLKIRIIINATLDKRNQKPILFYIKKKKKLDINKLV